MSRNVKSADNMEGGGKHWTKAEIEARQAATDDLDRDSRIYLKAPSNLSVRAKEIWEETKRKARGLELFDNLDTRELKRYCDMAARFEILSEVTPEDSMEGAKDLSSLWRQLTAAGEKLGLNPSGRARLAKKRTEEKRDDFADQFDRVDKADQFGG